MASAPRNLATDPHRIALRTQDTSGTAELVVHDHVSWLFLFAPRTRTWGAPGGSGTSGLPCETHDVFVELMFFRGFGYAAFGKGSDDCVTHVDGAGGRGGGILKRKGTHERVNKGIRLVVGPVDERTG